MKPSAARALLWLAVVLFLPLPFFGLQSGLAPCARLLFLGSLVGPVFLSDPDPIGGVLFAMFAVQGALQAGLLYWLSGKLVNGLLVDAQGGVRTPILCGLAALLLLAALFPIYDMPMSSSGQLNLFGIFD